MKPVEPEGRFSGFWESARDMYLETAVGLQMRLLDFGDWYERTTSKTEDNYFRLRDEYQTAIDDAFSVTDPIMLGLYLGKAAEDYGVTAAVGNAMVESNDFLSFMMQSKGTLNGILEYSGMDLLTLSSIAGIYGVINGLVEKRTGRSLEPEMKIFLYFYMASQITGHIEGARSWLG
jgi:hypothetical protein